MGRSAIATVLLNIVLITSGVAQAQEPQRPQGEDAPATFTTEDARTARQDAEPSPEIFEQAYTILARGGVTAEDVAGLRARLDSGGELQLAFEFDVSEDARVVNLTLAQGTGFESLDRLAREQFAQVRVARDLANFRNVRIWLGVTKVRARLSASATAPNEAQAVDFEQEFNAFRANKTSQIIPVEDASLTRNGNDIAVSLSIRLTDVTGGR